MAEYLDRTIRSKEHIHHKDGNPFNDSIENLELLSCSEHMRKHALGRKWKKSSKEKMSKTMEGNTRLLGHNHSEETKNKISKALKGRKLSDSAKENIRKAKQGVLNPMYGKPSPMRGRKWSEESKKKLSASMKRLHENKRSKYYENNSSI